MKHGYCLSLLLLAGCVGSGTANEPQVITAREWRYRDWNWDVREIGRLPANDLRQHSEDELARKASAVNLINLINAGYESDIWRQRRIIRTIR